MSIWVYNGWWAVVALAAPVLIARHYQRRLTAHGVGISRNRAGRYTAATEVVAAVLWLLCAAAGHWPRHGRPVPTMMPPAG